MPQKKTQKGLKAKIGPVPVWAILAGAVVVYLYMRQRNTEKSSAASGTYSTGYGTLPTGAVATGAYGVGANVSAAPSGLDPTTEQALISAQSGLSQYIFGVETQATQGVQNYMLSYAQAKSQNQMILDSLSAKKKKNLSAKKLSKLLVPYPAPPPQYTLTLPASIDPSGGTSSVSG